MTAPRTPPRYLTLVALAALSTVTLNLFLPALPAIAADLDASYGVVSLSVGLYLGMVAVVQLVVGPWSDRIGRRPVVLIMLALFILASIGAALSTNVFMFLAFRMLQAGIASGQAVAMAIVRDTSSRRDAASRLGYISMAMAIAPILGPMIGGFLDGLLGWRAIFDAYAIAGALLLIWCWFDLGETRFPSDGPVKRQRGILLRDRRFWAYAMCGAFSTGGFFVFISTIPLIASDQFGMSSATLGLALGSITTGFMLGAFFSGRMAARMPPLKLILIGRLCPVLGLSCGLILSFFLPMTPALLFGATVTVGLGNGLTMPSINAGAMSVNTQVSGGAAGLSAALNVGTGALLSAAVGPIIAAKPDPQLLLAILVCVAVTALTFLIWLRRMEPQST